MLDSTYSALGSRNNFNKALRHFFKVTDFVDEVEDGENIADLINEQIDEKEMVVEQILPVIGAILRDKFSYSYDSYNIPNTIKDFAKLISVSEKWTAMDIVIVYYNPNNQIFVVNPKNEEHWERVREFTADQLIVVYSKYLKNEDGDEKIENDAIVAIEEMIAGKDVFLNKAFVDPSKSAPQKKKIKKEESSLPNANTPASGGGAKKRITPKYSVVVTNELFHNGNVEAWKKIIESFYHVHPDLVVHIYYEDEVINDINTLFQWGKVKHGGLIFFQVEGENIRNVSKLQKYLFEGASQRFEQFLKAGVGQILSLF